MKQISLPDKIETLGRLGDHILSSLENNSYQPIFEAARIQNPWFTVENSTLAFKNIAEKYLNRDKLQKWISAYSIPQQSTPFKTGLIMAGNIPLVGFHDFLCVFMAGHHALIKLSSKDKILTEFILSELTRINPDVSEYFTIVERLNGQQAVIATGSDNSARYFEYYFREIPHIIRKNRTSVAFISGNEEAEDLDKLASDIFSFFGLGCRNISKVYLPESFPVEKLIDHFVRYEYLSDHFKFSNNYFYRKSILLLNQVPHLDNGFILVKEDNGISSPIAMLYYEYYTDKAELELKLEQHKNKIQVIIGNNELIPTALKPGIAQSPELWDYADEVDTMDFFLNLR